MIALAWRMSQSERAPKGDIRSRSFRSDAPALPMNTFPAVTAAATTHSHATPHNTLPCLLSIASNSILNICKDRR